MLSKELKFLEENLLIERKVETTRPVSVSYNITEYGKTCKSVMGELYRWGVEHRKKVFNIEGLVQDKC